MVGSAGAMPADNAAGGKGFPWDSAVDLRSIRLLPAAWSAGSGCGDRSTASMIHASAGGVRTFTGDSLGQSGVVCRLDA
jgi:hypothetical protein